MAKGGNQALKSKALQQAGMRKRGQIQSSRFMSDYQQGLNEWRNGTPLNTGWTVTKQQGWKRGRDEEMRFFIQTGSDGAYKRLQAQGVPDEALDAMLASEVA